MKKLFIILIVSCLSFSCKIRDIQSPDFIVSVKYYDSLKIQNSEFYYDSKNGTLRNYQPEVTIVKLDNISKKALYSFYKKNNLKNNCCVKRDKKEIEKYFIKFNTKESKITKCLDSTDVNELRKMNQFVMTLLNKLQSTEQYKKAFPEEFMEY